MSECGCKPGNHENGWHEVRSKPCIDAELAAWEVAMSRAREWAFRISGRDGTAT